MGLKPGERSALVMQSDIRAMSIECARVGGINLSQGVCDTPVPPVVLQGAADAVMQGVNTYTHHSGLRELRQALADKQRKFTGMEFDPECEIVVSAGSTGALYCTVQALLERGDEVLIFEPFYGYHVSTLRASDAVPVFVPLEPPEWSFTIDALETAVTSKTKAILINTPANPCGKVFSIEELEQLASFAIRHDLFVFTDEMYEHFVFDGRRHVSMATLSGMRERTITISGLSKTFSITGWRIGYAMGDARWMAAIGYFNDLYYVCAPSPLQAGVTAGLRTLEESYYQGLSKEYEVKRDLFCKALAKAGFDPYVPQGAYYVLAGTAHLPGATSREKALYILHQTGVASVPGAAFYHDGGGENLVRFCFAKQLHILDEACDNLVRCH
jgi:aminotransferase